MAEEFGLVLKADSTQIDRGADSLDRLARSAKRAEKENDSFGRSASSTASVLKGYGAIIAGVITGLATSKLVTVTRDFQALEAQLVTSTGSAENAAVAFEALQQFAATTPFSLEQSVEAFNKLVNLGLTPSERALKSYGDTASAMGKDMMQLVEAVADAATGEFERLKEFGIKSRAEGDKVAFTFRGTTTEVANNAAAIEEFLIGLGEVNFAGAMEKQMDTLNGAISNLSDTWDNLWRVVSEQGAGELIEETVRAATDAIAELTAMIESGQLGAQIGAVGEMFGGIAEDAQRSFETITKLLRESGVDWEGIADGTGNAFVDVFAKMPANVRAAVQIAVIEAASMFDKVLVAAGAFVARLKAIVTSDTIADVNARTAKEFERLNEVRLQSIDSALKERDATVQASADKIAESERLRKAYDEEAAAKKRAAAGTDQLAQFAGPRAAPQSDSKADKKAADDRAKRLESLQQGLLSEEELENMAFQRRLQSLDEYNAMVKMSEGEKNAILERLTQEHEDKLFQIRLAANPPTAQEERLAQLEQQFLSEAELEQMAYENKLLQFQEYAALKQLSEAEQNAQLELMQEEHEKRLNEIRLNGMTEAQRIQSMGMASQVALVAGGLSDVLSAFDNGSGKFIKAAQIAGATQALIATYVGQAESLKLGWPLGPLAALKIAAAGFGFVNAIKSGGKSSPSRGSAGIGSLNAQTEGLQAQQAPTQRQVMDFRFSTGGRKLFRDEEVKEMMMSMSERMKDGDNTLGNVVWTA